MEMVGVSSGRLPLQGGKSLSCLLGSLPQATSEMSKPKKQESAQDFAINFLMGGVSAAVSKVRQICDGRRTLILTLPMSLHRTDSSKFPSSRPLLPPSSVLSSTSRTRCVRICR